MSSHASALAMVFSQSFATGRLFFVDVAATCCTQLVRLGQGGLILGRNARVANQRHQTHRLQFR